MEFKRFTYILNGSEFMVDILRKGQGLIQSKEIEEQIENEQVEISDIGEVTEEQVEEIEDLKEEAQALDIESDYFAEEDDDNAQRGDYED